MDRDSGDGQSGSGRAKRPGQDSALAPELRRFSTVLDKSRVEVLALCLVVPTLTQGDKGHMNGRALALVTVATAVVVPFSYFADFVAYRMYGNSTTPPDDQAKLTQ